MTKNTHRTCIVIILQRGVRCSWSFSKIGLEGDHVFLNEENFALNFEAI